MGLFYFALGAFLLLCLSIIYTEMLVHWARKSGRYPAKGQVTMNDVGRLVCSGDTILAIRAYRELTGASLKKAKGFIEEMKGSGH